MKKGDRVTLVRGGQMANESECWWKIQDLKIGKTYEVTAVTKRGDIVVNGGNNKSFIHNRDHFELKNYAEISKNYNI